MTAAPASAPLAASRPLAQPLAAAATELSAQLAGGAVCHLIARISHVRTGAIRHAFRYRADYLLFCPEALRQHRGLLRRNRFGLFSLHDRDHGGTGQGGAGQGGTGQSGAGQSRAGQGAAWARAQFSAAGILVLPEMVLGLLTQPRMLGLGFNPVSFWLLWHEGRLVSAIAEVNNTFGERHSYLCRLATAAPGPVEVAKVFHVSPFQDVAGGYRFRFAFDASGADVLICHQGPVSGLVARMQGRLVPLTQSALLRAALLRPGGALRILGLIFFEALRLKLRGIRYRARPLPPTSEISE